MYMCSPVPMLMLSLLLLLVLLRVPMSCVCVCVCVCATPARAGSPNMTATLPAAYAQNTAGWLAASPCARAPPATLRDCLLTLTPAQVLAAVPPEWSPPTYFPQSPGGNRLPALVVIDGITLTLPLPDALARGLVDVPLIMTTMRDVRIDVCVCG